MENTPETLRFTDLGLGEPLLRALSDVGYESPSPIQSATIPPLLEGRDMVGQAQTGTGKTAAFALPILNRLDAVARKPQALVLTPTRELAIQVAEAFQKYATHIPGFHVLPIYGGQAYGSQLSALKRGVHVVVGTPGRIIDHLERGSLDLSALRTLVLDEADEMLRMGFIDDVETVLKKTPETRQVALFSATMPAPIRRIAQTYLRNPVEIAIKSKTTTVASVRQRFWYVSGLHKLDALTRILEAEPFEAMIVFARTKQATEELAEKLAARGFSAAAINGDVAQPMRERTIQRLKDGQLDILVATDVAARGLDVERISHVLNYDIPTDTESYVHRIGRTGRAGRSGEAILFVTPREKGLLRAIERATRQPIEEMTLPSIETVNDTRVNKFLSRITAALGAGGLDMFRALVERYEREQNVPAIEVAAALAKLLQGDAPLLLEPPKREARPAPESRFSAREARPAPESRFSPRAKAAERREYIEPGTRPPPRAEHSVERGAPPARGSKTREAPESGMETFRIEVGHTHGVQPGNIVGAIANEAGLESRYIGRIDIREDHSFVDLPEGIPVELLEHLKKTWVAGQRLRISRAEGGSAPPKFKRGPKPEGKPFAAGKPAGKPFGAGKPAGKPFAGKPGDKPFPPRKPRPKT